MTFSLLSGFNLNPSSSSGDDFSVRLERERICLIIDGADISCHHSTTAEARINRPVRVKAQQNKRSSELGRQVDASANHDFAVRQNEQPSHAFPDEGYGDHFA